MKRSTLIALVAGLAAGAAVIALLPADALFVRPAAAAAAGASERWACPMMDFIGNRPGSCPVCGMDMQRVTAGELSKEQQRRMGLETVQVAEGPARVTVRAYGAAEYDHRFTQVVIPRVAGRIVKRHMATFGCCQEIEAGAPVVDLYSTEVIAAQGELEAAVKLGDARLVAALRQRFERWNLGEIAARIEKGGALEDVVTVHSPFAGQVLLEQMAAVNEMLEVGREVMPDTPLLRLVDPDKLVLVVHVPEARARFLAEGQAAQVDSDDRGPLTGVTAVVNRVAQEINPEIRTREVRIYLTGARQILPCSPPACAMWRGGWRNARRRPAALRTRAARAGSAARGRTGNDLYVVRAGLQAGRRGRSARGVS
jgi:Cu(I)/Ag(I) efflux system membrane fusion protein